MSRLAVLLVCAGAIAGCRAADPASAPASSPAARTTAAPARSSGAGRLTLNDAQLAKLKVEQFSSRATGGVINAAGTVEFNGDRTATLRAPIAGQVQRLAANVGDTVKKGQVLFMLSSRDVAAAVADHETARKALDLAERTHATTQDLYEHQAGSRMSLQQSENELAKAQARVQQTEENLVVLGVDPQTVDGKTVRASTAPVRAPLAGTIVERVVTDGQFVGADTTPLMTITDLSSVWVEADVFERDLRHISINQPADVTTGEYPADRFVAHVSRVASAVDPQTHTAKVRLLAANTGERLKPGMYASIDLHLPEADPPLTVPAQAVFAENGETFVFVQVGTQDVMRRTIRTAPSVRDRVKVVAGLSAGDKVVTEGVLLLRQLETEGGQ